MAIWEARLTTRSGANYDSCNGCLIWETWTNQLGIYSFPIKHWWNCSYKYYQFTWFFQLQQLKLAGLRLSLLLTTKAVSDNFLKVAIVKIWMWLSHLVLRNSPGICTFPIGHQWWLAAGQGQHLYTFYHIYFAIVDSPCMAIFSCRGFFTLKI